MKRVLKSFLAFMLVVPFMFLLTACGETKSLNGNKYVYSKVEVSGTLAIEDYESMYSSLCYYEFGEETVVSSDGEGENQTWNYKYENGKVYIKSTTAEEYSDIYFEISGKYLIVTETVEDGQTFKVYFKQK